MRWCPDTRGMRVSCHGNMCSYCFSRIVTPYNVSETPHGIDWVEKFSTALKLAFPVETMNYGDVPGFGQCLERMTYLEFCHIVKVHRCYPHRFSSELMGERTGNYVSFSLQIYMKAE